jgi:pyroglutamyl-peptidase
MRLLMTGFEPFGDWDGNPSWDALVHARDHGLFGDLSIELARLPVSYSRAWPALAAVIESAAPEAVVCFGLHGGMRRDAGTIYVETTGRNRDGAAKADNDGEQRPQTPIVPGAPEALPARLPVHELVEILRAAGYQSELSDDAGAYLCNHVFFRTLHSLGPEIACGFVHVPPVESSGAGMSTAALARAMALIAQKVAGAA